MAINGFPVVINASAFIESCERQSKQAYRGCRNQKSGACRIAVKCARTVVDLNGPLIRIDQIEPGMICVRAVARKLGTCTYPDNRDVIDICIVHHVTESMIIGTNRERIPFDRVIAVEIPGCDYND